MNFYKNNLTRFDQEEEPEVAVPENPIEKMMGGMMFDKKFLEQRKVFLWGEVNDKSAREITNRLLYLEAMDPGKEITFYINSPGGVGDQRNGNLRHNADDLISGKYRVYGNGSKHGKYFAEWWSKRKTFYFPSW